MNAKTILASINASPTHRSRRSRSEGLLRFLMASSYPHAIVASLSYGLTEQVMDSDEREKLALTLHQMEKEIPLDAFFRCIEITRNRQGVTIVPKVLDLENIKGRVDDNPRFHLPWSELKLDIEKTASLGMEDKKWNNILRATVSTIAPDVPFGTPIGNIKWTCYHPVVGTQGDGKAITDLTVKHERATVTTQDVIRHLEKVVAGHTFKIFFTPKAIVTKVLGSTTTFKHPHL